MLVNSYLVGQVVFNNGWHRMCPLLTITTTTFFIYCVCNTEIQGKKSYVETVWWRAITSTGARTYFVKKDFLVKLINNYSSSPNGLLVNSQ